jgi:hypothetical protein
MSPPSPAGTPDRHPCRDPTVLKIGCKGHRIDGRFPASGRRPAGCKDCTGVVPGARRAKAMGARAAAPAPVGPARPAAGGRVGEVGGVAAGRADGNGQTGPTSDNCRYSLCRLSSPFVMSSFVPSPFVRCCPLSSPARAEPRWRGPGGDRRPIRGRPSTPTPFPAVPRAGRRSRRPRAAPGLGRKTRSRPRSTRATISIVWGVANSRRFSASVRPLDADSPETPQARNSSIRLA